MSWPDTLQRLGCTIGRYVWSRWQYYCSDAARGRALYKYRRCVLCGCYETDELNRIEADHVRHYHHPPLHYDPG